jgi:hypothetical protein
MVEEHTLNSKMMTKWLKHVIKKSVKLKYTKLLRWKNKQTEHCLPYKNFMFIHHSIVRVIKSRRL